MMLSVVICTYDPDAKRLSQALSALKAQSLGNHQWELFIVDNNSSNNFDQQLDLSWHPSAKIVKEIKQGLTYARLRGFGESTGDIIVMVDDDNILAPDYLEKAWSIFDQHREIGAIGGKSAPLFEADQPDWLPEFYGSLALRDLGEDIIITGWNNQYPNAAPIGAGMAVRRRAVTPYIAKITSGNSTITDRTAKLLSSGGDNDMVIEILKAGWKTGYFPELKLQHIIPAQRMRADYLARLEHDTNKSWVQLLHSHGMNPWKKIPLRGVLPRKIKAWFTYKAWSSKGNYIKWQGACGTFEGLAALAGNKKHAGTH